MLFHKLHCRCTHITDIGVGYLSTMTSLTRLFLRWCTQLRDFGLQHLYTMKSLKVLSLAGIVSYRYLTTIAIMSRVPQKRIFQDFCRCHTKRRIGKWSSANPCLGMTLTIHRARNSATWCFYLPCV